MEEEDDDDDVSWDSYGGSSSKRQNKKNQDKPEILIGLTSSDEMYPTDLPKGAKTDFDWCDETNVVREVTDQGDRRTCWTISSNRSLSTRLVIEKGFKPPAVCLSARHLLVGLIDEVDRSGGLNDLTHMQKFFIDYGAISEDDCRCPERALDYKKDKKIAKPVLCTEERKSKNVRVFKVQDFPIINKVDDEKELMRLLIDGGPVAVCMDTDESFVSFRGDGIYNAPTKSGRLVQKHMFLVVGYGTRRSDGIHYWKIQNSAGTKWGKDGYGKIARQISRGGAPSHFTCIAYPKLLEHYEGQS